MHPVNFFTELFMIALIDCRASEKALSALKNIGAEVYLLPPSPSLQTGVASHTDMIIFIGFGRLFCHESYYENNKELLDTIAKKGGLTLSVSNEEWSQNYPNDVLFNACIVGNKLVCNSKTVSKDILLTASKEGYEIINVNQGYTKCSVCIVCENAIITSDKNIEKSCKNAGIDVLSISEGHISLPPYDFGFIGGTCGSYNDQVFFCGSLSSHPNGDHIRNFCLKHGKSAVSLSDNELQDVGSIFFIGE